MTMLYPERVVASHTHTRILPLFSLVIDKPNDGLEQVRKRFDSGACQSATGDPQGLSSSNPVILIPSDPLTTLHTVPNLHSGDHFNSDPELASRWLSRPKDTASAQTVTQLSVEVLAFTATPLMISYSKRLVEPYFECLRWRQQYGRLLLRR